MLNVLTLLAASEAGSAVKRNVRAAGYYAVAACAGVIGLVFLLIAARDALLPEFGLVVANLIVGGTMVVVGLLFAVIAHYARKRRGGSSALASTALVAAPLAARALGKGVNGTALGVIGMLLAGAAAGHFLTRKE